MSGADLREEIVLVLSPTGRDARLIADELGRHGFGTLVCSTLDQLCAEIDGGAGLAVLAEEALPSGGLQVLVAALGRQPPWSDLPLLVLTGQGTPSVASVRRFEALEPVANFTQFERPVRTRTLLSAIRAALRARRRQYDVRGHLAERERLLREVEAERVRLAEVFRDAPSFLCVLRGPDHVFERANQRYVELVGGRDVLGKTVREALPEVESQGFLDILDHVYRTGEPFASTNTRITLDLPGGAEERVLEFVYQPLRDAAGGVTGILVNGVDLTDRERAQAGLARVSAESERQRRLYETVLSATPDFIYVFSLDHKVLYANDALIQMWGRGRDGAIGKNFLEIGYEPWHAEMHSREIDQVRKTKRPIRGEVPFHGTLGRRIYDYIFVPVFGADGEVEAVAGTTRDVTDRKQAEESLRDADRKKDEFLALLAHELRNPLAPLRNGLQVIRLSPDRAARERSQSIMDRQLGHMVRLIDDLLDVSRISRNKMELRRARLALTDVVSSAVETVRPAIDAAGHELTVSLPDGPVYLDADLTRLAQVFGNLLGNSAKYTPRGGRIWLHASTDGGHVTVSVSDNGIGIPAESLPTIFDMFSQVDRSIERSTGGLGIGLALVKGLVEMHGGTVTAASDEVAGGSKFTVRLPMLLPGPTTVAAPQTDSAAPVDGSGRRVLVVDDNRDSAESMAEMLKLLGYSVAVAHDGLQAVEEADKLRPDLVLMDVGMPCMNGLDATRRIRERPWGREAMIVALTGWGQDVDRVRSREAGCDGHLMKPVSLTDLQSVLGKLG